MRYLITIGVASSFLLVAAAGILVAMNAADMPAWMRLALYLLAVCILLGAARWAGKR